MTVLRYPSRSVFPGVSLFPSSAPTAPGPSPAGPPGISPSRSGARPRVTRTTELVYEDLGPALANDDDVNGWVWLSLIEVLCGPLAEVDDLVRDGDRPGWVGVFDAATCPPQHLPWLAQWAGVRYDRTLPPESNRARIRARQGSTAGTTGEMAAAVRSRLAGGAGVVRLLERDTGPHHVTVQTFASQTPDLAGVREAIAAAKPARVIVDLQVLPSASYAAVRASKPGQTYADRQVRYPTYYAVTTYVPGG